MGAPAGPHVPRRRGGVRCVEPRRQARRGSSTDSASTKRANQGHRGLVVRVADEGLPTADDQMSAEIRVDMRTRLVYVSSPTPTCPCIWSATEPAPNKIAAARLLERTVDTPASGWSTPSSLPRVAFRNHAPPVTDRRRSARCSLNQRSTLSCVGSWTRCLSLRLPRPASTWAKTARASSPIPQPVDARSRMPDHVASMQEHGQVDAHRNELRLQRRGSTSSPTSRSSLHTVGLLSLTALRRGRPTENIGQAVVALVAGVFVDRLAAPGPSGSAPSTAASMWRDRQR